MVLFFVGIIHGVACLGVKQLPMKVLVSVRCGEVSLEKRILRDTLELVSSFCCRLYVVNGARHTGGRGAPIRFIKRELPAPHRDGFRGSCAKGIAVKP
jgi:hypothetical protein